MKVCIRVRPFNEREQRGIGIIKCVHTEDNADNGVIVLDRGTDTKKYSFDIVANS